MIGTCDQSNEFLLVHMSASMFKLSVIEVRIVRLEHVSIDFAAAWSYLVVCELCCWSQDSLNAILNVKFGVSSSLLQIDI